MFEYEYHWFSVTALKAEVKGNLGNHDLTRVCALIRKWYKKKVKKKQRSSEQNLANMDVVLQHAVNSSICLT